MEIDVVITWVDSSDKQWQERINQYSEVTIDFTDIKQSVRYNSIGEIEIAIKSILKFAPFIRNIFLVTDHQKPEHFEALKSAAKRKNITLNVIDHTVIFKGFEEFLPCFNSLSIESMLFRIPDLAEHFIYFNDDFFLMRSTSPTDFFIEGKPVIRGQWESFYENQKLRKVYNGLKTFFNKPVKKKSHVGYKQVQQTSAKLVGFDKYVNRHHTPVSMRKSTLETFFKDNNLLRENIKYRFRNQNQFLITSLSEHLEIKNKTFSFKTDNQLTYFRSYKNIFFVKLKLFFFLINKNKRFMTFQSLELADPKTLQYILGWINKRLS